MQVCTQTHRQPLLLRTHPLLHSGSGAWAEMPLANCMDLSFAINLPERTLCGEFAAVWVCIAGCGRETRKDSIACCGRETLLLPAWRPRCWTESRVVFRGEKDEACLVTSLLDFFC